MSSISRPQVDGFVRELSILIPELQGPRQVSLCVALSGGIDSMALLFLLNEAKKQLCLNISIFPVHIDHKLRPESTKEAMHLKGLVEHHFNLELFVVTWTHDTMSKTGLQHKARAARYALLSSFCSHHAIPYVLTAHHKDDQLETFLMRLLKGSDIQGLTGIPAKRSQDRQTLVRPLLGYGKDQLKALLEDAGIPWIEDRSNKSLAFERNRCRQAMGALDKLGISIDGLEASLKKIQQANESLEHMQTLYGARYTGQEFGWGIFEGNLTGLPFTLFKRLLFNFAQQLNRVNTYAPAEKAYEDVFQRLSHLRPSTVAGLYIVPKKNRAQIFREPNKCQILDLLAPQATPRWDGLFSLEMPKDLVYPCRISPLTAPQWQRLRAQEQEGLKAMFPGLPGPALFSLPTLHTSGLMHLPAWDAVKAKISFYGPGPVWLKK